MKKYLNTLFILTQGAYLCKEGETVLVKVENTIKLQVPIHTISGIVCFGQVTCSPFLMGFCAENNVAVSFLTEHGRFLASVHGETSGNVLLRREQYRKADDMAVSCDIARTILTGKIANCRTVLQRALRDHPDKLADTNVEKISKRLGASLGELLRTNDLNVLRGIEGESANSYFSVFGKLIISQNSDFCFEGRNRRPPLDNVNWAHDVFL